MVRGTVPGARLNGHTLARLPGGATHIVHWSTPASGTAPALHYFDLTFYDSGRGYRLFFTVRDNALVRWRDAIGYIVANFSTTGTPRPCCTDAVTLP